MSKSGRDTEALKRSRLTETEDLSHANCIANLEPSLILLTSRALVQTEHEEALTPDQGDFGVGRGLR